MRAARHMLLCFIGPACQVKEQILQLSNINMSQLVTEKMSTPSVEFAMCLYYPCVSSSEDVLSSPIPSSVLDPELPVVAVF